LDSGWVSNEGDSHL